MTQIQELETETYECMKAMAHQRDAEQLKSEGLHDDAIDSYEKGIAALGDTYHSADVIDDTGMKLILAEVNKGQGKMEAALHLFHSVLASRIDSSLRVQAKKRAKG